MPHPAQHPAAASLVHELETNRLSRRDFLTRTTALGLSAGAAAALGGFAQPVEAQAQPRPGGTLRIQQDVRALKDPRRYDWPQIANFSRGWLEYLVEYNRDGSLRGMLLEGWTANEDASRYTLRIRPGVTWSTGEPFDAQDVLRLFIYWCDARVEGNSMATRLASLIDPGTEQLRDGAVVIRNPLTVELNPGRSDITLIPGLADYPAACVHASHDPDRMLEAPVGTGPYLPESLSVGDRAVLVRNTTHAWWGASADGIGGATLERIEFVDKGTDPATWLAAAQAGEIDMLYQNVNEFIGLGDALGWQKSEVVTGSTVVLRGNQRAEIGGQRPYSDVRIRKAVQASIDNAICLELGYGGFGAVAADHHVAPVHPEYADIGPAPFDPAAVADLLAGTGLEEFEHELVTLDDGYTRNTGDAAAAMMRDAGMKVRRKVLPGSAFWDNWTAFPLSVTEWNHRPLGLQILSLIYRSGAPWNESGYANPDFDAKLDQAMALIDADARRAVMAELQTMLRDDAVIVQPYWRTLYRHMRPDVLGAEMHPSFEIHLYKLGLAA